MMVGYGGLCMVVGASGSGNWTLGYSGCDGDWAVDLR
ncbi:hypothetical protein CASFOL_033890 [Castilleja foliolosa]|uniref:Uncharacterized protein n=1 Tax=Castilleja foliolosa TaxID=1961234 RepID=A0ABD3BZI2_9LAMI